MWNAISYTVGLKEANDLLAKVYLEVLSKYPLMVFQKSLSETYYSLIRFNYYSIFPVEVYKSKQLPEGYGFFEDKQTNCKSNFISVIPKN